MTEKIRDIALRYLAYRDRSEYEVSKYLKEKDFAYDDIENTLIYLNEFGYIDDKRYCENYINYAILKGRGRNRIKRELKEKGISYDMAQIYLDELIDRNFEFKNALKQAEKLIKNNMNDEIYELDEKMKAKVGRRLFNLGYNMSLIYEVINNLKITNEK
ncbi:regulatory protein RecX [Anaerovorax odorimutans]|uniref:regulatory protein RecX n=1 Tax=Anaerovorax odorimutans TaxID=109327 RepID=UPI00041DC4A1|nr:regulatory protein RecX [Anaerovorax odorimutans]